MPRSSTYTDVVRRNPTEDPAQENVPFPCANTNDVNRTNSTAESHAPVASPTRNSSGNLSRGTNTLTRANTNKEQMQRDNSRSTRPAPETNSSRGIKCAEEGI